MHDNGGHAPHMHHFAHGLELVLFLSLLARTSLGRFLLLLTALWILW
jgi:hypothetical protein